MISIIRGYKDNSGIETVRDEEIFTLYVESPHGKMVYDMDKKEFIQLFCKLSEEICSIIN